VGGSVELTQAAARPGIGSFTKHGQVFPSTVINSTNHYCFKRHLLFRDLFWNCEKGVFDDLDSIDTNTSGR
jgi:hypothetical protein